jgi:hypothetical protein
MSRLIPTIVVLVREHCKVSARARTDIEEPTVVDTDGIRVMGADKTNVSVTSRAELNDGS